MWFSKDYPKDKGLYGLFNDSFPPIIDGVTLTVENYARWISHRGNTPCIVTPWNPEIVPSPYHVMRFLSLPIQNRQPYRYGYPKLDPYIWRRLRNTDFKIVHAHCPFSSGRLAVYVKKHQGIPLIGTFHSKYKSDLQHSFRHFPFCVPIIMKRILNFFNACDEVWIPQPQVEETVRKYGYKGHLTVVENGNDFASLIQEDVKSYKLKAKKRLGFKEDEFHLLFVGQHIWEKGLKLIIDTLEELKPAGNIRMDFIGHGYAMQEMEKIIEEKGLNPIIKFNGLITDRAKLSDFYAASDLFFFPSLYDNAPLVVREAAAMGTPSLLLKGSTASEVIADEINGYLVNDNKREIASLIRLLDKEREKLTDTGIRARNSLVRSWEDIVDEVLDRYNTAIKTYSRSR
ncbi:MAG: glycosyltransferase [Muribaculaceae bacterium]|nr:glycosyltransferase [Muribaculaceae bacterium]